LLVVVLWAAKRRMPWLFQVLPASVGCGFVGSKAAYAMALSGVASE